MKKFYIFFFVLIVSYSSALTYHWRQAGGNNLWNNLNNWEILPGNTIPVQLPQSTDDVLFDAATLIAGNYIVDINVGADCRNFTVNSGNVLFQGTNVNVLQIFGDLNANVALGIRGFTSSNTIIKFIQSAGTKIVNFNNNNVNNNLTVATGNCDFTTGFIYTGFSAISKSILIETPGIVNFNGLVSVPLANISTALVLYCANGTVNINAGMNYMSITTSNANTPALALPNFPTLNINSTCYLHYCNIQTKTVLSCINQSVFVNYLGLYNSTAGSANNFTNSKITACGFMDYTSSTIGNYTNSKIIVNPGYIAPNGYLGWVNGFPITGFKGLACSTNGIYNVIECYGPNLNIQSGSTATVDSFLVHTNIAFTQNTQVFRINTLLQFDPGVCVQPFYSTSFAYSPAATMSTFLFLAGSKFVANGTCQKKITFKKVKFNTATAVPTTTLDYLVLDYCFVSTVNLNAGANSYQVPGTLNTGWNAAFTPTPRTLIWLNQTGSVSGNYLTYGRWSNTNCWTLNGVTPGECPPTPFDSVVFPANSLVREDFGGNIATPVATCKSMNWLGAGELYDSLNTYVNSQVNILEIYGSLKFMPTTINNFKGYVWFKAWQSYPTITSSRKRFNYYVYFEGGSASAKWTLTDSLKTHRIPLGSEIKREQGIQHLMGHLNLNGNHVLTTGYLRPKNTAAGVLYPYPAELSLTTSDFVNINVLGNAYGDYNVAEYVGYKVNCGTSNIKFVWPGVVNSPVNCPSFVGGGFKYYNITFAANYGVMTIYPSNAVSRTDTVLNKLTYNEGGFIYSPTWPATPAAGKKFVIHKLISGAVQPNGNFFKTDRNNNAAALTLEFDSALVKNQGNFNINSTYNNLLKYYPNKSYLTESAKTHSFNSVTNANWEALGSCAGFISVTGGNYTKTAGSNITTLQNVVLTNANAGTVAFNITSGIDLGGNTGTWAVGVSSPRRLFWVDGVAGVTNGNWYDPNRWAQSDGGLTPGLGIGECPPTPIDTVFFTNLSFTNANDTVAISGGATGFCHSMRWLHGAAFTPVFKATINESLQIFGSLIFSSTMQTNLFAAYTYFRGTTTNTVDAKNKPINGPVQFRGDIDNTTWKMTSAFNAAYRMLGYLPETNRLKGAFQLYRGKFYSQGNNITAVNFASLGNAKRTLSLGTSTVNVTGYHFWPWGGSCITSMAWYLRDSTNNMTFKGDSSYIYLNNIFGQPYDGFCGGGKSYGIVRIAPLNKGLAWSSGDTIKHLILEGNASQSVGCPAAWGPTSTANQRNSYFKKVTTTGTASAANVLFSVGGLTTYGRTMIVDSMVTYGGVNVLDSAYYRKYFKFAPGKTYRFQSGKVQYVDKLCDFNPIGTGANIIQLQSTNVSQKAWIRKDSARICADFVYLLDLWAIGNGASMPAFATPGAPTGGAIVGCGQSMIWRCDTVLASSYYTGTNSGPILAFQNPLSGRAVFQGGANANDQGGNKGWEFTAYPPVPSVTLSALSPTVFCAGDSTKITFNGIAQIPFILTYTTGAGTVSVNITNSLSLASYTPNTGAFSYTTWVFPVVTGTATAMSIGVARCFNAVSSGVNSITYSVNCSNVLPIELANFSGTCVNNNVELKWATYSENNNNYFMVHRSSDAVSWEELGRVAGAGNSNTIKEYKFNDPHPDNNTLYYRIMQIDYSGKSKSSKSIGVSNCKESTVVSIYPNPTNNTFNIKLSGEVAEVVSVEILNVLGQKVLSFVGSKTSIDLGELKNGVYFVSIKLNNKTVVEKIVLEK